MKRKVFFLIIGSALVALMAFNTNFKVKSDNGHFTLSSIMQQTVAIAEDGGYSCTVTTNCIGGSVSCTGTSSCSRTDSSVTCDGHTTNC